MPSTLSRSGSGATVGAAGMVILAAAWVLPAWTQPLGDPDLWWLLWAGEQMNAGRWPARNALSWTAPEQTWRLHEWLVAFVYGSAGLPLIAFLRGLVVSACAVLLVRLAWLRDSVLASLVAMTWAVILVVYGRTERALSWGNLLLACQVTLLSSSWRHRHAGAAVLIWLWAQVHGSWIVGLALLAVYNWRWAMAAAGLTLINPHGLWLWGLVLDYGRPDNPVHTLISEWQPLWPRDLPGAVTLLFVLAPVALIVRARAAGPRSIQFWRFVVIYSGLTLLALWHQRFTDVLAIACLPHVRDHLAASVPARCLGRAIRSPVLPTLTFCLGLALAVPNPGLAGYPDALLSVIPRGRIWNEFRLGGYLGRAGVAVFWDSRNDCYPPDVLRDAAQIERMIGDWPAHLDRWKIQTVITRDSSLRSALIDRGWYAQGAFAVVRRKAPGEPDVP